MRKSYATNISDAFNLHSPEAQKLNELLDEILLTDVIFNDKFEEWYLGKGEEVSRLEYEYRQEHGIYE
jgi:hypothetical protein